MNKEDKIIEQLDELDEAIEIFQDYANTLKPYIDDAMLNDNADMLDQYIDQRVDAIDFLNSLKMLKSQIEMGAHTSIALSKVSKISNIVKGLKGTFKQSPDTLKLKKALAELSREIKGTCSGMKDVVGAMKPKNRRGILQNKSEPVPVQDRSPAHKREYMASLERISQSQTATIATTDDIDFEGLIRGENNKDTDR